MKETDFYPELSEKFRKYLFLYLPENSQVEFSYNKALPKMVEEIKEKLNCNCRFSEKFIPSLQLDILFGIKIPNEEIKYILFEVKYMNKLALAEFSQLIGYLQVAKEIKIGILLLVTKNQNTSSLSNDFSDILLMKKLPMRWSIMLKEVITDNKYEFETGICSFVPNNGIDWVDTNEVNGISSFEVLVEKLI
jgi:hypothetical protein